MDSTSLADTSRLRAVSRQLSFLGLPPRSRPRRAPGTMPRVAFFVESEGLHRLFAGAIPEVAAAGISARLISLRPPGPLHRELEDHGVRTFSLACESAKGYGAAAVRLGRLLRRDGVDILHSCEPIQAAIGGIARFLSPEVVHIFHRQHMWISLPEQRFFSEMGTRLSHYTLANSQATAEWVREVEGVPTEKVRMVHYGVPALRRVAPAEVDGLRRDLGITNDVRVILLIGYFRLEKGHRVLLEALPTIRQLAPRPVHVVFVGSGPDESQLREECRRYEGIHFPGYRSDIAPWLALADVVAMPSLYDAFPQVGVEALAARRPLVASAVGGLKEIVDERSGVLVPPGNPRELATAIVDLLRSPERAEALAAAGYERFERYFTIEAMAQKWATLYQEVRPPPEVGAAA